MHLRAIARTLEHGDVDPPTSTFRPSPAQLRRLADLGDRQVSKALRADRALPFENGDLAALLAAVSGPGDLLAAELAAAHARAERW